MTPIQKSTAVFAILVATACFSAPLAQASSDEMPQASETAESSRSGPITLRDALALAMERNSDLAVFSWELRAAEARRIQAGLRPNPEVAVSLENVSGDLPGLSQSELTLSLGQVLELGGKRAARVRAARAEEEALAKEWDVVKLSVLAEATRRFIAALSAEGLVTLQEEVVRIAEEIRTSVTQKVQAGAASPAEEMRTELELQTARLLLRDLQEERSLSRTRLGSLWGDTDPGAIQVAGSLDSIVALPSREVLLQRLERSPEIISRLSRVVASESRLTLVRSERVPDLEFEAGYRRLEAEGANTFVGGVTVPLPLFGRNQGSIALAQAEIERARAETDRARVELARLLAESHSLAGRTGARADVLQREILPTAERAFQEIKTGYERGRFSYIDLLEARRALTDARREKLQALSDHHLAVTDLELLLGEALFPAGTSLEGSKP